MNILRKTISLIALALCMMIFTIASAADRGQIDWSQGQNSAIEAVGIGLPPENAHTSAQAKLLARRAAVVDAYRNLLEMTQEIQVDSETTMKDLMIENDTVKTQVSGIIQGAKIKSEKQMSDGSYRVVLTLNLFGENSLAAIALPKVMPSQVTPFPTPIQPVTPYVSIQPTVQTIEQPAVQPQGPVVNPVTQQLTPVVAPYTPSGVIVDARGLGLEATYSPAIYDTTGRAIYGTNFIDPDFAIKYGMTDYAPTPELVEEAQNGRSRAGTLPIIVKAVGLKGNNHSVIISQVDADKILAANQIGKFLNQCEVVFFQ